MISYTHPARTTTPTRKPVSYTHPARTTTPTSEPIILRAGDVFNLTTGAVVRGGK